MAEIPKITLHEGSGKWEEVQLSGRPSRRGATEAIDVASYAIAGAIEQAAIESLPPEDQGVVVSLTQYRLHRNRKR